MDDTQVSNLLFAELPKSSSQSWIVDGFPRTLNQAKLLNCKLKSIGGVDPSAAFILDIPLDTLRARITGSS